MKKKEIVPIILAGMMVAVCSACGNTSAVEQWVAKPPAFGDYGRAATILTN